MIIISFIIEISVFRYAELEHFTSLPFKPLTSKHCDIVIDKPVWFMKLDAGKSVL